MNQIALSPISNQPHAGDLLNNSDASPTRHGQTCSGITTHVPLLAPVSSSPNLNAPLDWWQHLAIPNSSLSTPSSEAAHWSPPLLLEKEIIPINSQPSPSGLNLNATDTQQLRELIQKLILEEQRNGSVQPSGLTTKDLEQLRAIVREEANNVPMSTFDYVLTGMSLTAFVFATYSVRRIRSKIKHDFGARSNERSELLYGREPTVFQAPKVLIIRETLRHKIEERSIREVDNPEILPGEFDETKVFGNYSCELASKAGKLCTPQDPFFLEHIKNVSIPFFRWASDAFVELNWVHFRRLLSKEAGTIREISRDRIERELKILIERAFSEGGIDALEGKQRALHTLYAIPLCQVNHDGTHKFIFPVVREQDVKWFREPELLSTLIQDNPKRAHELQLIHLALEKEFDPRDEASRIPSDKMYEYPEGHSRHALAKRTWRYLIPIGVWLKPNTALRNSSTDGNNFVAGSK